jgi:predicted DNA-binding protein
MATATKQRPRGRPRIYHPQQLRFHVRRETRSWLSRWAKRTGRDMADVCREILEAKHEEAHKV